MYKSALTSGCDLLALTLLNVSPWQRRYSNLVMTCMHNMVFKLAFDEARASWGIGASACTCSTLCDHLLTLACIDVRFVKNASFLKDSSLLDPKERRVLSCSDISISASTYFAHWEQHFAVLEPLCGDRPVQAAELPKDYA